MGRALPVREGNFLRDMFLSHANRHGAEPAATLDRHAGAAHKSLAGACEGYSSGCALADVVPRQSRRMAGRKTSSPQRWNSGSLVNRGLLAINLGGRARCPQRAVEGG